ncbi:hypothetical protein RRG08_007680 [Elysia crispata]|uniref:Uncharacterized protein n=1 Tax=Elysia crispata TaxID=231223 RepID=A0AAE0Y4T3_9GAST|nr:hypothetical protein RRG08_007680 [Elysia crispata]
MAIFPINPEEEQPQGRAVVHQAFPGKFLFDSTETVKGQNPPFSQSLFLELDQSKSSRAGTQIRALGTEPSAASARTQAILGDWWTKMLISCTCCSSQMQAESITLNRVPGQAKYYNVTKKAPGETEVRGDKLGRIISDETLFLSTFRTSNARPSHYSPCSSPGPIYLPCELSNGKNASYAHEAEQR